MRVSVRPPIIPSPDEQPDRIQAAGLPESAHAADGALSEPRAAMRWASSPLLRGTSPLTVGRQWKELKGARTRP